MCASKPNENLTPDVFTGSVTGKNRKVVLSSLVIISIKNSW